jgi:alpha-amylase
MTEQNGVMMQFFHWYTSNDGSLWNQLNDSASYLAKVGITAVWLPPAYKGASGCNDTGYGVYDLFDLGEFDQKGSVRTKYGTRDEYLRAIRTAQSRGIQVYADIAFNSRIGADEEETCWATPFSPENHRIQTGDKQQIRAWTNFTFPGRRGKYSELQWHWWHFTGTDRNSADPESRAVFLFDGKSFESASAATDSVNFLMGCNVDTKNPDVRTELLYWGKWYLDTTGIDGFRIDAVKNLDQEFVQEWIGKMRQHSGKKLFAVGEYWSGQFRDIDRFIAKTQGALMLFDVRLHFNFTYASKKGAFYDLRRIFDNSLVKERPDLAVTFVNNHDTQALQLLESGIENWFIPLAYALILLRKSGYPCVFAADYFGAHYSGQGKNGQLRDIWMDRYQDLLNGYLYARKTFSYGPEQDYFDDPTCIGWTRLASDRNPAGMATLLSTGSSRTKRMNTHAPNRMYYDLTGRIPNNVLTDEAGWGEFSCQNSSVSVWIPKG